MALNMFRGDILAYPLFLQKRLADMSQGSIKYFCSDVACKYFPCLLRVSKHVSSWLRKRGGFEDCRKRWMKDITKERNITSPNSHHLRTWREFGMAWIQSILFLYLKRPFNKHSSMKIVFVQLICVPDCPSSDGHTHVVFYIQWALKVGH